MRLSNLVSRSILPLLASLLTASTAAAQAGDTARAAARVTELADAYLDAFLRRVPEAGTQLALPGARHDALTDNSLEAVRRWQALEDSLLRELDAVNPALLAGRPEWITNGFLREGLESSRGTRVCRQELWPVNQMSGWHTELATLASIQPVDADTLRAQALARWRSLPRYIDTEIANLREGLRQGYSTPKRNVGLVIEQLDALLAAAPEESPFFSPAQRDGTPAFRAAWRALVADEINPAIRRYRDYLANEYQAAARENIAVSANPNGRECWRAAYRAYTTVDRTPEEVFELGRRTVERNLADMRRMGRELFGTDDPAELVARLRTDPANRFRTRDEVLAFSRDAVQRAHAAVPRWFGIVPKAPVVVEPIPAFRERAASSHYNGPSDDGTRPGTYYINLYQPEEQGKGTLEVTAFHETYPGHHLQVSIGQENARAHRIARFAGNSGYQEGWGRYSEALAEEMGLYQTPHARLGRRAWPARGMVVDPGLHVLGWTREQAVSFILEAGFRTRDGAESLVDRVVVWPAQLTAYDSGGLEIFALREKAQRALGERFDIREFHDRVLEDGSLTLGMLRQKIDRWIAEKQASAPRS